MSLAASLCKVAGRRFGLWDSVMRQASTAADQATGMAGDLLAGVLDGIHPGNV